MSTWHSDRLLSISCTGGHGSTVSDDSTIFQVSELAWLHSSSESKFTIINPFRIADENITLNSSDNVALTFFLRMSYHSLKCLKQTHHWVGDILDFLFWAVKCPGSMCKGILSDFSTVLTQKHYTMLSKNHWGGFHRCSRIQIGCMEMKETSFSTSTSAFKCIFYDLHKTFFNKHHKRKMCLECLVRCRSIERKAEKMSRVTAWALPR